jgi:RNA polymerase sigma-70 factor (ECF subfamily)
MPNIPRRVPDEADSALPPVTSEAAQLERVRDGDEAVFGQLFKTYYRGLCSFVFGYVRSQETAEELVQTVFLRIWERRERWAPAVGIRAYLFAACRNAALDHLKHVRIVERTAGAGQGGAGLSVVDQAEPVAADAAIERAELEHEVRRAVQELPERCRDVVVLRWQHGHSNAEVAQALGISVKTVETHVSRALAALRARLGGIRP